nr:PH domain-containing protein [Pirellula staleyi]
MTPADEFRQKAQQRSAAEGDTEKDLWNGSFSPKAMYGYWLLATVITVASLVVCVLFPLPPLIFFIVVVDFAIWLGMGAYLLYQRMGVAYHLTSQRLIHHVGILRRVTNRIEMIDINDVSFEQGLIERMLGVGTIKILSSDTSHPSLVMPGIDDVKKIAAMIDDVRREERRRRGMFIESI